MTTKVYSGRYTDNGIPPGTRIRFVGDHFLYPFGKETVIDNNLWDAEGLNGHDAVYIIVERESKLSGMASWMKEKGL